MNKEFEIRSSEITADSENKKLVGYVVKWDSPSEVLYCDFVEQFSANAFSESLSSGAD
ncbi:MAG: HK97 family phage prohead protease, partial [Aggregatibacter aphrophilus]